MNTLSRFLITYYYLFFIITQKFDHKKLKEISKTKFGKIAKSEHFWRQ